MQKNLLSTGNHNQTTFEHQPSSKAEDKEKIETQTLKNTSLNITRYGADEGCSEKNAGHGYY